MTFAVAATAVLVVTVTATTAAVAVALTAAAADTFKIFGCRCRRCHYCHSRAATKVKQTVAEANIVVITTIITAAATTVGMTGWASKRMKRGREDLAGGGG